MDPTKASLIPSSPSLEADNNALEKKSDDVIQPAKIKYSLPADHVNRELKFPLEKK